MSPDEPTPLDLGRAAAARLSGEWQLEAEAPEGVPEEPPEEPPSAGPSASAPPPPRLFPSSLPAEPEEPPSPRQIVEAMLFVGGPPLTAAAACAAVRGLTPDRFQGAIEELNRKYRAQRRPYAVVPREGGHALVVLPAYRGLRERLFGGPKEARLSPPALDVLSIVAYRQPATKAQIDAVRGADSAGPLRQLVRLGLVAVQQRADAEHREVRYGTTPRLLKLFGLRSLDDLPRLGDTQPM